MVDQVESHGENGLIQLQEVLDGCLVRAPSRLEHFSLQGINKISSILRDVLLELILVTDLLVVLAPLHLFQERVLLDGFLEFFVEDVVVHPL